MRVVSVNVGLPRDVYWQGRMVSTGIFKEPVEGPVRVARLNLDGEHAVLESLRGRLGNGEVRATGSVSFEGFALESYEVSADFAHVRLLEPEGPHPKRTGGRQGVQFQTPRRRTALGHDPTFATLPR